MTPRKKIWITGASSGIGRQTAIEFSQRGYEVIVSGRNQDALNKLAQQINGTAIAFDVTDRLANLAAARQIEQSGGLDILFLNAGTCEYLDIKNFNSALFERTFATNFFGMVYGIEAALPLLRASTNPHLIGMSSTVAYAGLPRVEAYGASKAAIRNMFESLRIDLLPEKIAVSVVCPGFVKTPLTDKNDFPMPGLISAKQAAVYIANGIEKKRQEIYFPIFFSLVLKFLALLPSPLYTYLIKKLTQST